MSGNNLAKVLPIRGRHLIQSFAVRNANIDLRSFSTKTFLNNLRAIDLSQTTISDISVLSHAYLLKRLWLSDCQLRDYSQVLKVIRKMKFLEVLDLRYAKYPC